MKPTVIISLLLITIASSSLLFLQEANELPKHRRGNLQYTFKAVYPFYYKIRASIYSEQCIHDFVKLCKSKKIKEDTRLDIALYFNDYQLTNKQFKEIEYLFSKLGEIKLFNVVVDDQTAIDIISTINKKNTSVYLTNFYASAEVYEVLLPVLRYNKHVYLTFDDPSDDLIAVLLNELNHEDAHYSQITIVKHSMSNKTVTDIICSLQNNKVSNLKLINGDKSSVDLPVLRECLKNARQNDDSNVLPEVEAEDKLNDDEDDLNETDDDGKENLIDGKVREFILTLSSPFKFLKSNVKNDYMKARTFTEQLKSDRLNLTIA